MCNTNIKKIKQNIIRGYNTGYHIFSIFSYIKKKNLKRKRVDPLYIIFNSKQLIIL